MLACARIGAPHNVVFGGFSAEAVRERMEFSEAKVADHRRRRLAQGQDRAGQGPRRRGDGRPRDARADRRRAQHGHATCEMQRGPRRLLRRDLRGRRSGSCPAEPMDAEDPLFILYTSRLDGQAEGDPAHDRRLPDGRLARPTATSSTCKPETDVYWCAADVGWVTGPLLHRLRPALQRRDLGDVRGRAGLPRPRTSGGRSSSATASRSSTRAPTAIRTYIKWGRAVAARSTTSRSLRLLGSVGEPINPKAWLWYHKVIGGGRCPIVDTWWQTETGAIMITPLPGHHHDEAGLGDPALSRGSRPRSSTSPTGEPIAGGAGTARADAALAVDAAHALQGRRALRRDLLLALRHGDLPRRRRRAARHGRLLLGDRADRRRRQRLRAPPLDGRGRVGDRRPPRRRRGGGDRPARRGHRPGDRRLRHAAGRSRGRRRRRSRRIRETVAERIGKFARPEADHLGRRPAEDALGQDHAPAAARHRRGPRARRRDDAARPRRDGAARGARQGDAGEED